MPDTAENIEKAGMGLAASSTVTDVSTQDTAQQTDTEASQMPDLSEGSVDETQRSNEEAGEDVSTADEADTDGDV